MNWAVLGAGRIALEHFVPSLSTVATDKLVAVGTRDPQRAQLLLPANVAVKSYADVLERPDVDAVYIALPNSMHCEWTVAALNRGKVVLCEKPIVTSHREALAVATASAANRVPVYEAFMYREHSQFAAAVELMPQEIGEIRHVHAWIGAVTPASDIRWSAALAGGALNDLGCYAVDFACHVFDDCPVAAKVSAHIINGVDARLTAVLDFPASRSAVVTCALDLPWVSAGADLWGSQGTCRIPHLFNPGTAETEIEIGRQDGASRSTFLGRDLYAAQIARISSGTAKSANESWLRTATAMQIIRNAILPGGAS